MPVWGAYQLKRHFRSAVNTVFVSAGRAKLGMASERNKLKPTTMRAAVHGAAVGRIPAIDHFLNILHDNVTGMQNVLYFLIMVSKNLL